MSKVLISYDVIKSEDITSGDILKDIKELGKIEYNQDSMYIVETKLSFDAVCDKFEI